MLLVVLAPLALSVITLVVLLLAPVADMRVGQHALRAE